MSEKYVPTFTLNDGVEVPAVGLGTWKLRGDDAVTAVRSAIDIGYRHIDTAALYRNEADIGRAIRDAISAGDVTREELFITSKVWNDQQSDQEVQAAFRTSLTNLGLDYLDCYMVHWPCPSTGRHVERFAALGTLQGLGDIRSIAVANYNGDQLRDVQEKTGIVPTINQVELHPGFSQAELREAHAQLGVLTEAWSPLAQGDVTHTSLLADIADKYGVTPAQVAPRWIYQLGVSSVPKSATATRQAENLAIFNFELSESEMSRILQLDNEPGSGRRYADPDVFPGDDVGGISTPQTH